MSYEHNYLKNLFLGDEYANALFQKVMEKSMYTEPEFSDKILRRAWARKEIETDHDINDVYTIIENDEWDIGIETSRNICMYASESKEFYKKFGDFHSEHGISFCSEDDPKELMITHDLGGEGTTLCVDVCKSLGEEYPYVIRDMERKIPDDTDDSCKYVLIVEECSVESCDWEDLVDIFDQHDITLVSFKELMQ
jgi:hypothetical protein